MIICFIVSWSNKSNCLKYEKYTDMDYMHLVVGGQSWERGTGIVLKYPIMKLPSPNVLCLRKFIYNSNYPLSRPVWKF